MKIGLVGLGKMGFNLGQNLIDRKHEVVAFDLNTDAVKKSFKHMVLKVRKAWSSSFIHYSCQGSSGSWFLMPWWTPYWMSLHRF